MLPVSDSSMSVNVITNKIVELECLTETEIQITFVSILRRGVFPRRLTYGRDF